MENCSSCGKRIRGNHGDLCSICWRKTPEGREWQRLRVSDYRSRVAYKGFIEATGAQSVNPNH